MKRSVINKVKPIANESLESFAGRLQKGNYYEEDVWLQQILAIPAYIDLNFLHDEKHLRAIAECVRIPFEDICSMTVHRLAPTIVGKDRWEESERNIFIAQANHERRCPKCAIEQGTDLLPWLLRPVTTCQVHHIVLGNRCTLCNELLSGESHCTACGSPVSEMSFTKIDSDRISLTYSLFTWKLLMEQPAAKSIGREYPFSQMLSPDFFSYLTKMGSLLLEYDPDNPRFPDSIGVVLTGKRSRKKLRELSVSEYHQVMIAAFDTLSEWPLNLHSVLNRILVGEGMRRERQQNNPLWKRKSFPYAVKRMVDRDKRFVWLWDALQTFIHSNESTAKIQYWHRYVLDRRIAPTEISVALGSFPVACSESNPSNLRNVMNMGEAAAYLKISRSAFKALVASGLIKPLLKTAPSARTKWCFSQKDVDDAVKHIVGDLPISTLPADQRDLMFLNQAFRRTSHAGVRWIDLLNAVYTKKIIAYRSYDSVELGLVWTTRAYLTAFLMGNTREKLLTIYDVMKIIGCGTETLQHLVSSELLVPVTGSSIIGFRRWRFTQQSIDDFQQRYISTEDASKIVGCATRTLLSWVEQKWIVAASGPSVDGVNQYRFDRDAIVKWRRERLSSKELREFLSISQRTMESWIAKRKLLPMQNMPQHPYWFDRGEVEKIKRQRENGTNQRFRV